MTHAVAIELENWFRFKGQHRIELGPGVYGVTARTEDDPERSNWIGKSTFLATMPFVLTGWHPARTEDGWITPGEAGGRVKYLLSDGATIERTRAHRRKATQLEYVHAGVSKRDAEAQAAITANYGMNEADLFMAAFFKQKEMNRLLSMDAAERFALVSTWLDLGPLQRAESAFGDRARDENTRLAELQAKLTAARQQIEELARFEAPAIMQAATAEYEKAKREVERLQKEIAATAERAALQRDAEEFASINARGLAIKNELGLLGEEKTDEEIAAVRTVVAEANAALGAKRQELKQVQAGKGFDGLCPVAGIQCPARAHVEASVDQATHLREQLAGEIEELEERAEGVQKVRAEFEQQANRYAHLKRERDQLRPRALALVDAPARLAALGGEPVVDLQEQLAQAQQQLTQSTVQRAGLGQRLEQLAAVRAAEQQLIASIAQQERTAKLERTGVLVYKAAQRVVAEGSMQTIEAGTNSVLNDSSIDLGVRITWAREGAGLAKSCDQCGAAYPTSAKVKVCAVCGGARGKHMVEKLEIGTTDISGAAEDLAGIAIRLAASRWLRARRGTAWSMAAIDEPFGSLDGANKRALSTHLATMLLGRYGFEQAFVVAHDRGIMDALPNRIELIGDSEGTHFGK